MKPPANPHYRHRFPAEIISHAVCLYHVLSLQDVVTKALAVPPFGLLGLTRPPPVGAGDTERQLGSEA
jgi:hypothetical protein